MFSIPVKNIYLANNLVDMRKSFNTLSEYVSFTLGKDPLSGDAFVFIGKNRNRLKVLIWEESGFWLCNKRLEKGSYSKLLIDSLCNGEKGTNLSQSQWHNLLEGIIVTSSKKLSRYRGLVKK